MSFGSVLKKLRKSKNMTQEQLAQKLSISPQAISRWENDFAMPDISLIVPISEIFDVSTDTLLRFENMDFDLEAIQHQEAVTEFKESLRALLLLETIYACETVEKILDLIFEDKNLLDFHDLMIHCLTTKARLLHDSGNTGSIVKILKKAQYHATELDKTKLTYSYPYTNKLFEGLCCCRTSGNDNTLYSLNTAIVYSTALASNCQEYKTLVEEIKKQGTYYVDGITSHMIGY